MKNKVIIASILVLIVIIAVGFILFNNLEKQQEKISNENYNNVLTQIEAGNKCIVEQNKDDSCFSFRYFNRGCYYDSCKTTMTDSNLQNYNLTKEEIVNLCYKFAHKGATAYCLNSNSEKQKCIDFAGTNNYLIAVCELPSGKLLPSKFIDGEEFCKNTTCFEPIKYSELK